MEERDNEEGRSEIRRSANIFRDDEDIRSPLSRLC